MRFFFICFKDHVEHGFLVKHKLPTQKTHRTYQNYRQDQILLWASWAWSLCRNINRFRQMRQYPKILIFWHEGIIMVVSDINFFFFFIFQANIRNQEIVYQHNIAEKYYKIWKSELCWDIWGLFMNGHNITHFYPINYIITHMTVHFVLIFENLQISGPSLYNL